ncbi:MAG: aminotransferase class III-fold pyridoxal phosphate-dependent enzyme, partial [Nonomuraea sp.]|nr:aminotransferase class III-fold pyridoxal phosphate-dependent enzyme [Nonomuraea sp.]
VYQAGTLSGNPLACAAGLATLRALDAGAYARVDAAALAVGDAAAEALAKAGVPHRLQRAGSLFSIFFTDAEVTNFDQAKTQNTAAFTAFFHAMLDQGVYLPPSAYEAWFLSSSHDDEALNRIADALPAAAKAAAAVL